MSGQDETKPSRPCRVVILGDHHAANRGDQAIVKGLLRAVDLAYDRPEVTILSNAAPAAAHFLGRPAVQSTFFGWTARERLKRHVARAWLRPAWRPAARWVLGEQSLAALELLDSADVVLMKGGAAFTSAYGMAVLIWFDLLEAALALGKPVAVCGQSVGPLSAPLRRAAASVFPRLGQLIIRDQDSMQYVHTHLGRLDNLSHLPDTAFFMLPQPGFAAAAALAAEGVNVGDRPLATMTVRRLEGFLALRRAPISQVQYEAAMAATADHLIETCGCAVLLPGMCTEAFGYQFDDRLVAMRVWNRMRHKPSARVLLGEYTSEQLMGIYGLAGLNVGTRMHSNILAMMAGAPCLGIAYEHKTSGIFRDLDLADWWISLEDVSAEALCGRAVRAWRDRAALAQQARAAAGRCAAQLPELVRLLRRLRSGQAA